MLLAVVAGVSAAAATAKHFCVGEEIRYISNPGIRLSRAPRLTLFMLFLLILFIWRLRLTVLYDVFRPQILIYTCAIILFVSAFREILVILISHIIQLGNLLRSPLNLLINPPEW